MSERLGDLIRESFERYHNEGFNLGERVGRQKILDEQQKLQGLLHRDFHKIFRPFCWLFGHSWSPIWCACKICYMSGEEMIQRNTDKEKVNLEGWYSGFESKYPSETEKEEGKA